MSNLTLRGVLGILRREDIPAHEVRRGDLIAEWPSVLLVARVEHHDDGSVELADEDENGTTYPPHGRDWKVRVVARGCLIDNPFQPWD